MPYRRLPTTDLARIRALETAVDFAENRDSKKLAFSKAILHELKTVKLTFENSLKQYESDIRIQADNSKVYKLAMEKARIYLTHFVQVVIMGIEREEIKPEVLSYYGLNSVTDKIPNVNDEEELLNFGNLVLEGDRKRIQKGGSPIYNPSIALVKFKLEEFKDAAVFQATLKRNVNRSYEKIKSLRKSTNDFIGKLWTEIELNIDAGSPKHHRQLAQEYGIVYVFRRKEKKKLKPEDLQRDLLFDFG